jgi:hypothetical protein
MPQDERPAPRPRIPAARAVGEELHFVVFFGSFRFGGHGRVNYETQWMGLSNQAEYK